MGSSSASPARTHSSRRDPGNPCPEPGHTRVKTWSRPFLLASRCCGASKKMLEGVGRKFRKRADDEIGVEILCRVTTGDTDAAHTRGTGGRDPGRRVLD